TKQTHTAKIWWAGVESNYSPKARFYRPPAGTTSFTYPLFGGPPRLRSWLLRLTAERNHQICLWSLEFGGQPGNRTPNSCVQGRCVPVSTSRPICTTIIRFYLAKFASYREEYLTSVNPQCFQPVRQQHQQPEKQHYPQPQQLSSQQEQQP